MKDDFYPPREPDKTRITLRFSSGMGPSRKSRLYNLLLNSLRQESGKAVKTEGDEEKPIIEVSLLPSRAEQIIARVLLNTDLGIQRTGGNIYILPNSELTAQGQVRPAPMP